MKFKTFILVFFAVAYSAFGQGLNNNFPIDSIDFRNVFRLLGMEVFKFPIELKTEKFDYTNYTKQPKYKIVVTIKNFEKGKLTDSIAIYSDDYEEFFTLNKGKGTLRLITKNENDSTVKFNISFEYFTTDINVTFNNSKIVYRSARAYSKFQPEIYGTLPVLIWYANEKGKGPSMHCPGEATPEIAAKDYDYISGIYLSIVPVKGK